MCCKNRDKDKPPSRNRKLDEHTNQGKLCLLIGCFVP